MSKYIKDIKCIDCGDFKPNKETFKDFNTKQLNYPDYIKKINGLHIWFWKSIENIFKEEVFSEDDLFNCYPVQYPKIPFEVVVFDPIGRRDVDFLRRFTELKWFTTSYSVKILAEYNEKMLYDKFKEIQKDESVSSSYKIEGEER